MFASFRTICLLLVFSILSFSGCNQPAALVRPTFISIIAGSNSEFGEVYSIEERNGEIFISDGEAGKIFRISKSGSVSEYASGLDAPSGIAWSPDGALIVAETGRNRIVAVSPDGNVTVVAGNGASGFRDGDAKQAEFRAPTDVAVSGNRIFVSDTYNDAIRVIENGVVATLAGGTRGYVDGVGSSARFNTPLGISVFGSENLLVADFGNHRLRLIDAAQSVTTLAGNGEDISSDGTLPTASFSAPADVAVTSDGIIYVADASSIRLIGGRAFAYVETLQIRSDGYALRRPSGLAISAGGDLLVADRESRMAARLSSRTSDTRSGPPPPLSAEEFRSLQPGRWPYEPPNNPRDIAGTLGEIRGEITAEEAAATFHNGLDIAGSYGEIARFVRTERVLDPAAVAYVGSLREMLRMPTIGYIHIRIGRFADGKTFDDARFQFFRDASGQLSDVRIPRGAVFNAGEAIGTLNDMNHVHLIAGRPDNVMNALAALDLPGRRDTIPPMIERVQLFATDGKEIETDHRPVGINRMERLKIVVTAYDKMDGNPERRKLGVYSLGYNLVSPNNAEVADYTTTIEFDRNPPTDAVGLVYDTGSRSGATGNTVFRYIITNRAVSGVYGADSLNLQAFPPGSYLLRVFASDFDGNRTIREIPIELIGN